MLVTTPRGDNLILRAFTQNDVNNIVITRGSWLYACLKKSKDNIEGSVPQEVSILKFNGKVSTPPNIQVEFEPPLDADSDINAILNKLKVFLMDKVIRTNTTVPFDYFGKLYDVNITLDQNFSTDESLSEGFGDMSLADYITSTPVKLKKQDRVKEIKSYFTVTSSTVLNLLNGENDKDALSSDNVKVGGFSKQMKILLETSSAIFSDSLGRGVNGILLYGPPGVGKSILALSLCSKLKCTYRIISGPELYSKFYGETEGKIRELFSECTRVAPCVLVLDDLDTFAPRKVGFYES